MNYVITLLLKTEIWQEHIIEKRSNIARHIYNCCLREIMKRYRKLKKDKEYRNIINSNDKKLKSKILKELDEKYKLSKFSLNKFVKDMAIRYKKNIGSQMAQEISERAYSSYHKLRFGNAKKVYYKKYGEFYSLREKTNNTGLRYNKVKNIITWLGLVIPVIIKKNDKYILHSLNDKIKYCRLIRKEIKGRYKYYIQITIDGVPQLKHLVGTNEVGIDIGVSTIAIVSDNKVIFDRLAYGLDNIDREKRLLQRKLDRSRRSNNEHKYNSDGTIKKNKSKWVFSNNYKKIRARLKELQRKLKEKRKLLHNKLANKILELGIKVKVEDMNYQGLQKRSKKTEISEKTRKYKKKKRYGKSLLNYAPAMLLTILDTKLKYYGERLIKIDTIKVKASQYNHIEDSYKKKKLSERWNILGDDKVQRDLYSAFIIKNVKDDLKSIDRDKMIMGYSKFLELHNKEIERIKNSDIKTLKCMGF